MNVNYLDGGGGLRIGNKATPSAEAYYDEFFKKEFNLKQSVFSKKGIEAIKYALFVLEQEKKNEIKKACTHYKDYMVENNVSKDETRSWGSLRDDFIAEKNYKVVGDVLYYKSQIIVGMEDYYDRIIDVVKNIPDNVNPSEESFKKRVQALYYIKDYAIDLFWEQCIPISLHNRLLQQHTNPVQLGSNAVSAPIGLGQDNASGVLAFLQESKNTMHVQVNFADNRVYDHSSSTVNNNGVNSNAEVMEELKKQTNILHKHTELLTEKKRMPPSAMRDERHAMAEKDGAVLDFEIFGEATSPSRNATDEGIENETTTVQRLESMTLSQIFKMLPCEDEKDFLLFLDNSDNSVGICDPYLIYSADDSLFDNCIIVDVEKQPLTVVWQENYAKLAAEVFALLLKKALVAASKSGCVASVDGEATGNQCAILPLSSGELDHMKCFGEIVFNKCKFTSEQQKVLPGMAKKVTLSSCQLENGGNSLAVACRDSNHMQVLQVDGSFPFEDPLSLTNLLHSLDFSSQIDELCVKGGAVQDCVKNKKSFTIFTEKIIEDALAKKTPSGLRKFVFDLHGCDNIEKERFMTLFALQPIKEYLTGCEDPEKEYKAFLMRLHGGHFFPYSFRGISMEQFCQFLHIHTLCKSNERTAGTHQKTKEQTAEPLSGVSAGLVTSHSGLISGSVAPRRSNRLRGKPVDNSGLP